MTSNTAPIVSAYEFFDFKNLDAYVIVENSKKIKSIINTAFDQIISVNGLRTFNNTVLPYLSAFTIVQPLQQSFEYVKNFYTDKDLRDLASETLTEISGFLIECSLRKDIYNAFSEYKTSTYPNEKKSLSAEESRYFEEEMRDFQRNGLNLPGNELTDLKAMQTELTGLEESFSKNINDDNTCLYFSGEELSGMPSYWMDDVANRHDTNYRITMKYPDYIPAMQYIHNSDIRKKIYATYNSRAQQNNPILEKIVKLRYFIANKLGYATHADYKTETKIIENANNALAFEEKMRLLVSSSYKNDMQQLLEFAQTFEANPLKKDNLDVWDYSYYLRLHQEHICNIDHDTLRKYFPLSVVKKGMFDIYQKILGVTFTLLETTNKWHDDVEYYMVTNRSQSNAIGGEVLGYFYLDMFPREGKYSHAAVFDFMSACNMEKIVVTDNAHEGDQDPKKRKLGNRRPHIVTMACNFPSGGCISFEDVETLFHEFGHVMHQICSQTEIYSFCGFGVELDFVEALSQMLEYWCYTPESLQLMSSHEETGEKIPLDMINKLRTTKKVMASYQCMRQIFIGITDLRLHTMKFKSMDDYFNPNDVWYKTQNDVTGIISAENYHPAASFGHFTGYDAGYYGYLLSDTYAANMFYQMFDGHVLDPDIGMLYRRKLLQPGSTKPGLELLKDFLGTDPDPKYYLADRGFVTIDQ